LFRLLLGAQLQPSDCGRQEYCWKSVMVRDVAVETETFTVFSLEGGVPEKRCS